MQIAVLGPLSVHDNDGRPIEVAGVRLRALLTRLAIDAGRPVSVGALVDAVWSDAPPAEQGNALQTLVSRLRRLMGTSAVVSAQGGYRLAIDTGDIDVHRFERLAAEGTASLRAGEMARAADLLDDAVALWRGPALTDALAVGDAVAAQAARLNDLRTSAQVDRIEVGVELGDARIAVEAETLAGEHPLDERLAGLLMRALSGAGRHADALHSYERLRLRLADELGVDPSSDLQRLHVRLLQTDRTGDDARNSDPPNSDPSNSGAAGARRTNLKAQLTSFVGREREVDRIGGSLEQHRLVTLVGPGGAGKTRLAVEAASGMVEITSDGVWLVELAPVTSEADVPQAVLNSIGARDLNFLERRAQAATVSARDAITRLSDSLADRRAIIVLDNCEHLIDGCAAFADALLAHCSGLRILATSREPLGIVGEALLPVPPLGQPSADASAIRALEFPAVRLFADRAAAARSDFSVDDASVAAVIEIVRRLDGLPLAIELAAARLRTLPLVDVAARLSDRFRLLTGGSRTALPRHRTLRAVVEWSWDLLSDDERALAEQLSVFGAGVTARSAAAVAEQNTDDVADLLASLVDKSLLQRVGDGSRMRMLETIREYGAERLAERGELADVRNRHARHFAALMAEAEPHLIARDQVPWFELLAAERENVIAALRYLCDAGDVDAALTLAISLSGYALMLGLWDEIAVWLSDVIVLSGPCDPAAMVLARTLFALSRTATGASSDEVDAGRREMVALAEQIGDVPAYASQWVAVTRPLVSFFADLPELSERYFAIALAESEGWSRGAVLMFHAGLAENNGDTERQRTDIDEALELFTDLGERWGLSNTLRGLGQVRAMDGDLDGAIESYEQAMALSAQLNSREDEGYIYGRLADLEVRRGNFDRARDYVERVASGVDGNGSSMEELFALAMQASVEYACGNLDLARQLQADVLERVSAMPREHPAQGHIRAIMLASSIRLALEDGEPERAAQLGRDAWVAAVGTKDMPVVASVGVSMAEVVATAGDPSRAAVMLGATIRLRGAEDSTATEVVRVTALLSQALGADGLAAGVAQGQALDRESALAILEAAALASPAH